MKKQHINISNVAKISLFIFLFLCIQAIISYIYIRQVTLTQIENELSTLAQNIEKDVRYHNGQLDISLYTSDPNTPHPTGSGGFTRPLYVITNDGFVIERNMPISGLLDSSDFEHLQQFQQATTLDTVTKEQWRLLSQPIISNGNQVGTIVVAYYSPSTLPLPAIDQKLRENINLISNKIKIQNKKIIVENIDIRNVHYDVSFEVVDTTNKVLLNNGRMPTFIDRSYVAREMEKPSPDRVVKDDITGKPFFIVSRKITDDNGNPLALITIGQPIEQTYKILNAYLLFAFISSIFVIFPLAWLTLEFIHRQTEQAVILHEKKRHEIPVFNSISFDKKDSSLKIDQKILPIPYASNQYYILEALFSNPKKRWEQDELLERFGEVDGDENWRKVYDAHLAINKKTGFKLIDYKDKLFRINPEYLAKIV